MSQGGASSLCEIIRKKRDGEELEREELISFVSAVVNGQMQDTQIGESCRVSMEVTVRVRIMVSVRRDTQMEELYSVRIKVRLGLELARTHS